jgi:hypothetical protein
MNGIMSYITKKTGGIPVTLWRKEGKGFVPYEEARKVDEIGLVTITSKSADDGSNNAVKNIGDFSSSSWFWSQNYPGQWVCWDFDEMRINPTHYTMSAHALKSWVVEGSGDGERWTEIDRHTDDMHFVYGDMTWQGTSSFALSSPLPWRFIRLTQTGKNHDDTHHLILGAVEFFGTLSVSPELKATADDRLAPIREFRETLEKCYLKTLREVNFQQRAGKSFEGIIAWFTKKCGGNVHQHNVVTITSNFVTSTARNDRPETVADLTSDSRFCSVTYLSHSGQWICWDFGKRRVSFTGFRCRGGEHCWAIHGSVDGENWEYFGVGGREGSGPDVTQSYSRESKCSASRFLRLSHDPGHGRDPRDQGLMVIAVEFYGTLFI